MLHFLKLIRYQNLLLLAFMQFIFRYGFLKLHNVPLSLTNWQYALLVLSTVCIAAGGFVIKAIFEHEEKSEVQVNSVVIGKKISEIKAYNLYVLFTFTGVLIGFYLSNVIEKPSFALIFVLISSTLYLYASSLKQIVVIGHVILALVVSAGVLIIGLFDLLPATYDGNQTLMGILFSILIDYAFIVFMVTILREIVKDIVKFTTDSNKDISSLPIIIGVPNTVKIIFFLSFIPIIGVIYFIKVSLFDENLIYSSLYGLIFILSPLLYFAVKICFAKKPKDFHHLSNILKLVLFFGILSILVINLNILNNA